MPLRHGGWGVLRTISVNSHPSIEKSKTSQLSHFLHWIERGFSWGWSLYPKRGREVEMAYFLEETDKQYVVVAAGGHGRIASTTRDYLVAYALS